MFPILYDLYDLAEIAGWDPYNLHDLAQASCVGSVLCRYRTTPDLISAGGELDDLDHICISEMDGFQSDYYYTVQADSGHSHPLVPSWLQNWAPQSIDWHLHPRMALA